MAVVSTRLGSLDVSVSRLCFGTGQLGHLHHDFSDERGAELLRYAFDRGVTFWDTAQMYGTHRYVRRALETVPREQVVVNTKTPVESKSEGRSAVTRALDELGTDYVDSMMLHGVSSPDDFDSRRGCFEALMDARADGRVRHVGVSTHIYTGAVLESLLDAPEVELVLSHLNVRGQGLSGGDLESHMALIGRLYDAGKGVMIMKLLAAGKVPAEEAEEWISWGFRFPHAHSVNLGLSSEEEIDAAVRLAAPLPVH